MYKSAFSIPASKDGILANDLWPKNSTSVKLVNVPKLNSQKTMSTINYSPKPKVYPLFYT